MSKPSIARSAIALRDADPYIGALALEDVHAGTVAPFVAARLAAGIAPGTIARDLGVIRRILSLAARRWRHECGKPWLDTVPELVAPPNPTPRAPRPITWDEQARLIAALPPHLAERTLFALHTGCRDGELTALCWDWERHIPELDTTCFVLPSTSTKNRRSRVVVLNRVARSVVDACRGRHGERVFTYAGKPLGPMRGKGWYRALKVAGLEGVRVHDLRHTFGHRLRSAGVAWEDRQDLLGHHAGRITTHYSSAELDRLIEAVERIAAPQSRKSPGVALVRVVHNGR